jgi:3-hydroxyacyl-[acyl-carrier-protein] dehydratase
MRFELIDRVIEQDADRIVAVKALSAAEEYLQDHFPTFAVMPGVLMLEALLQAARRLLWDAGGGPWVLAEVRSVRYGNMVRPGQTLRVTVERTKTDEGLHTFKGSGTVDGDVAVQGRFVMRPAHR